MNDVSAASDEESISLRFMRRILLGTLVLGLIGTGGELLLLNHVEELTQWAPLVLIVLALAAIAWYSISRAPASVRALKWVMIAFVIAGFAGFYFHLQGSMEFKLESYPTLKGWELFWTSMRSKAPPPLAPGVMIQLGLIGLAFAHRHPALKAKKENR
jgi:hypothetical protein